MQFSYAYQPVGGSPGWTSRVSCRTALQTATAVLENTTGCANEGSELYLYGPHCGSLQWQYSEDRTTWKPIAGATRPTHTLTGTRERHYRCRFEVDGEVAYSNVVQRLVDCVPHGVTDEASTATARYTGNGGAMVPHTYDNMTNQRTVFYAARPGERVRIDFTVFDLGTQGAQLRFYDGPSVTAPLLATLTGSTLPPAVEATGLTGALTVVFDPVANNSGASGSVPGWDAQISSVSGNLVRLPLKVVLQGACDPITGIMHDSLRTRNQLPPEQPYAAQGAQSYNGCEAVPELSVLGALGTSSVVDWVLVELRDATDATQVRASAAALLLRDGSVKAPDGFGDLAFLVPPGNYYVVVRHRNHLPAMTAAPLALSLTSTLLDMSDPNVGTYGTHARHLNGSTACLWAGDANGDGRIVLTGTAPDTNPMTAGVLQAAANPTGLPGFLLSGYRNTDLNLSGDTQATNGTPDVQLIRQNVLTHPANPSGSAAFVIEAQLPQ